MEWHQKPSIKVKKVINRTKRSKTLNEVMENVNKNQQSFPEISFVQKEVLLSPWI